MYYDKLSDLGIKLTRRQGSEKTKCPQCSDGRKNKADKPLSVSITNGEYHCHNCGWKGNVRSFERKRDYKTYEKPDPNLIKSIALREQVVAWFSKRGISEKTLNKFLIFCREEWMPQTQKKENCIGFPYFRDGALINVKYRDGRKSFKMIKDAELVLFNMQGIGQRKKALIVEGELDCMAAYESGVGVEYSPVADIETGEAISDPLSEIVPLSVPNGASKGSQKLEYLDNCSEYLLEMEEIIIATDGDEAGEQLKEELSIRLGIEKCKFITYPYEHIVPTQNGTKRRCKDLNEVLQYLGKEAVISCIQNAQGWPIDGIHYIEDIFPSMMENFKKGIQLAPKTHFGEMDKYFRWKKGDVNLWVGYANHGKTFFVLQLMLTMSYNSGWKWAIFSPENYPANDFFDDLVEMYIGKWLDQMSEEEYTEGCHFINDHIFYVYPENEHDLNSIQEKFRYLVLKKGVDGVLVDPFNQLDRTSSVYQREDLYLSDQLKDIKRFALLNRVSYNIIAHPVKMQREQDKSYPPIDMYDIAGGAMFANKSDQIISYYRPNHHVNKTSTEVQILVRKVKRRRTGGEPGEFDLKLNWGTKRFIDPLTEKPFLNPKIDAKAKSQKIQTRMPYIDNTEEDISDEMPF